MITERIFPDILSSQTLSQTIDTKPFTCPCTFNHSNHNCYNHPIKSIHTIKVLKALSTKIETHETKIGRSLFLFVNRQVKRLAKIVIQSALFSTKLWKNHYMLIRLVRRLFHSILKMELPFNTAQV